MEIETKLLKGKFYCYATIYGYDYSFDGNTIDEAQSQMRDLLMKNNIKGNVEWSALRVIESPENTQLPPAPITYAKSRIDNNPFG